MREMKCPVCAGEVPRTALRSKTFPCPTCKESLRSKEWSPLWGFPWAACVWGLTFVAGERMGLKGWGLLFATIFIGSVAGLLVTGLIILTLAWVFGLPPSLERDPGPGFDDGGILHIGSSPRPPNGPQ